jgi:uncharacterized protein
MKNRSGTKERVYYVNGMHCAACEIMIEKKLLKRQNICSVEASTGKDRVVIEYAGDPPSTEQLNKLFKKDGYSFSLKPLRKTPEAQGPWVARYTKIGLAVMVALGLIILLQQAGLSRLVTVNSKSSLPAFLLLGVVAGFSSCAALVGGVVLSMSKQWGELYSADDPFKKRIEPHLLFNIGRLISYAGLGALLALIGSTLHFSTSLSAVLVIAISLIMVLLGLQMLGVKYFQRFQFTMPKSITRYVADETNFKGRYMPFSMGALTFFLPCGFTLTAQTFALISGNPLQGSLIMLAFALGTLPMLLIIGISSVKFLAKPNLAATFLKVAGVLVLFFALFNINNQLVVLNAPNLNSVLGSHATSIAAGASDLPPVVDGKQVLKMKASSKGYDPSTLKVRAGTPVLWEIEDTGTSGCTNAIVSRDLFQDQIALTPGQTSTKEFTAQKPGRYQFSCWMGMVKGEIDAVDAPEATDQANTSVEPQNQENTNPPATDPPSNNQNSSDSADSSGLPPIVDGKQVLAMDASASGYDPDNFKVRVGVPVRFEITDTGASGCTSTIISDSLFSDQVSLKHGQTSVVEFTPDKIGRFRFSCWMGMVQGTIDVVDPNDANRTTFDYNETTRPRPGGGGCCG